MSTFWAVLAAAQLSSFAGGQLAAPPVEPVPERATRLGDDDEAPAPAPPQKKAPEWRASGDPVPVPPPMPVLMPPLPLPAALALPPPKPPKPARFVTVDGKVHVGKVLRVIDGGFEFEDERGARYPIALSAVRESEHGDESWKVPAAAIPTLDEEAARKALDLAFDVYELEQERARLTYGEKALVTGLGLAACIVGFGALKGDLGTAVGIAGAVGAGGGGVALGVTALRSWRLSKRAEEGREQLKAMGAPANARATTVPMGAVAWSF
ncbi:MAG: hypothetical protein QM765_41260 [Myxococcales bacterium]